MPPSSILPSISACGVSAADGVYDDEVDRSAAYERIEYVERLFAAVRLREVEVRRVDAERSGEARVERVLRVYEGRYAAGFLRFGEDVERDGGFYHRPQGRRFQLCVRAGTASNAERHVERQYAAVYDLERRAALRRQGALSRLRRICLLCR